ncbi:MAG: hypothetical protein PHI02_06270 [Sulfurovaceae bacterium]|nr:hypothetical protein [Sulfurovaceae bacterium]
MKMIEKINTKIGEAILKLIHSKRDDYLTKKDFVYRPDRFERATSGEKQ